MIIQVQHKHGWQGSVRRQLRLAGFFVWLGLKGQALSLRSIRKAQRKQRWPEYTEQRLEQWLERQRSFEQSLQSIAEGWHWITVAEKHRRDRRKRAVFNVLRRLRVCK